MGQRSSIATIKTVEKERTEEERKGKERKGKETRERERERSVRLRPTLLAKDEPSSFGTGPIVESTNRNATARLRLSPPFAYDSFIIINTADRYD